MSERTWSAKVLSVSDGVVAGTREDRSGAALSVRVLPRQADEFTCSRCFLVHHRSQLASEKNGVLVCRECAA